MAGRKKRRETTAGLSLSAVIADSVKTALEKREDCILTFETDDGGNRVLHILTGNLITPCMLGTLSNRCGMPENSGCRHLILNHG